MDQNQTPILKDLVLVGGGHAHVTVLKKFGMKPLPGVRLTLISRDLQAPYSGMLPGFIAGHYAFDEAHIDLGPLARFARARFLHAEVVGIDPVNRVVRCLGRPDVPYDLLSINIGSAPATASVPGAADHAVPVKPIDGFIGRWVRLCERVLAQEGAARIGVVGGGAGGVELTLAAQYRLQRLLEAERGDPARLEFHLFTDTDDILMTHNRSVRAKYRRIMEERGVALHLGQAVTEVGPGRLRRAGGEAVALDEIMWVTMASPQAWLSGTGIALDEQGFIKVADTLESVSHPGIFAAGDVAHVVNHARPKSGVFAVRQGPPLARNLRRVLQGKKPRPFKPQRNFLSLISTGDKYAVASRSWWALEGKPIWVWKDWIDRRFIRRYSDLPEMDDEAGPEIAPGIADADTLKAVSAVGMRCGGCGAKVGASVLDRAVSGLKPISRDDVLIGLHAPDDAAVVAIPKGKVAAHTVDVFRAFIEDPYVFGQVAANHALGDIYAMGGEPQTALAIATIPYGLEAKVEDTLGQLMAGALTVLNGAGAALVGGHTSEGQELSLGFAVNGLVDRERILRKGGMRAGDRIVLTKPIGTGTLFAADMRRRAKGRWIAAALAGMVQSNREGAACLFAHDASACTDVTGFGVLGHLVEMVKPSGVDVELNLGAIPTLDGALETVSEGIFSSLQPQNLRLRRAVRDGSAASEDPRYPLLFDPQTAGGLMASVPKERAVDCVDALRELGYDRAAIIGTVLPPTNRLEPITLRV